MSDYNELKNIQTEAPEKLPHDIKIAMNQVTKMCKEMGIPMFAAFYGTKSGFEYHGVLPGEIGNNPELQKKYNAFLNVCIDFNKEEYYPVIKKFSEKKNKSE